MGDHTASVTGVGLEAIEDVLLFGQMVVNVWNWRLRMFYENKDLILQFTALVTGAGLEAIEVILLFGQMVVNVWNLRLRMVYEHKDFILQPQLQVLGLRP